MKVEEDTAHAESIEWETLNDGAMSLYHKGQRLLRSWNLANKGHYDSTVLMALYDSAVLLAKKALDVAEKEVGSSHPRVATSIDTLGLIYMAQDRYAEAESLYKRSLSIWEKSRGPDHPDVGYALNNLAEIYYNQDQYTEAEQLYKRSLAIWEKWVGPDHPDVEPNFENIAGGNVADTLNNLAEIYYTQGRYAEVESIYKRSLAIWEKWVGPDHPELITTLENMAGLYRKTGRAKEAESLEKRAARIREITNGSMVD